jgi:hypothetical protein
MMLAEVILHSGDEREGAGKQAMLQTLGGQVAEEPLNPIRYISLADGLVMPPASSPRSGSPPDAVERRVRLKVIQGPEFEVPSRSAAPRRASAR